EVAWMLRQVFGQAPVWPARQVGLAATPVAPVIAQDRLLFFLCGAVELGGRYYRETQRLLNLAENQSAGNELPLAADRAKALVVEIIRHALLLHFFERLQRGRRRRPGTHGEAEAIGTNVARREWLANFPEVGEFDPLVR